MSYLTYDVQYIQNFDNGKNRLPWSDMAKRLKLIGPAVAEPDYFNWCISPVMDDDQNVHLFVARWPKSTGLGGWLSEQAEIAHYMSSSPEGPFTFCDIAVSNAELSLCGCTAAHNPRVKKFGSKYALIFHCVKQDSSGADMIFCTRMKTADSPMGPWKDVGEVASPPPVREDCPDSNRWATNPDIYMADGKYYIYACYCYRHKNDPYFIPRSNGNRWRVWASDQLEGPYTLQPEAVTNALGYTEDITVFHANGKHCILLDDNYGENTGIPGAGLLVTSDDPLFFDAKANGEIGFGWFSDYYSGLSLNIIGCAYAKFERPAVLVINDKPAYFYAPSRGTFTGNVTHDNFVLKVEDSE